MTFKYYVMLSIFLKSLSHTFYKIQMGGPKNYALSSSKWMVSTPMIRHVQMILLNISLRSLS